MSGELLALGISHKTAPVELRERIALTEGRAAGIMRELIESDAVSEAAAVSTCNRTELYLQAPDPVEAESLALSALARCSEIRLTELVAHVYSMRGLAAAEHLYRVTAGLESMIVGESEVQGQVKRAYELALAERASGPILNRVFRGALAAGKRARTETTISSRALSVPQVAVEQAKRTFGELAERRVLVVGAGETAELTAQALAARSVSTVFIANRHHDRAQALAERFGGSAVHLGELQARLADADVVVSATSSPHHVIEPEDLEPVLPGREGRPLLLIDIAVPRDINPQCRELPGVTVFDMDDLQAAVERNASGREHQVPAAAAVLADELERLRVWLAAQEVAPTIAGLRARADQVVDRVLAENEGRWRELGPEDAERIRVMAQAIGRRLLHEPTLRIRRAVEERGSYAELHALRDAFGLDAELEPDDDPSQVADLDERRANRDRRR